MIILIAVFFITVFLVFLMTKSTKYSSYPPGPLSLPIVGSLLSLGVKPHEKLSQMKSKFGNIVAINFGSQRGVILNDLDTIKQMFSLKEVQDRPDTDVIRNIRGENVTGIGFSSGKTNEEQRAFVIKTLKYFGMGKKSIESLLIEEMQRLFVTLDEKLGTPVLNRDLFQITAVSALWSIMTGEHGKAKDPEFMEMMEYTRNFAANMNIFTLFLPTLSKLFSKYSGWNLLTESSRDLMNYVGRIAESKQKVLTTGKEPKHFVEAYLQKINSTQDKNSTFFGQTGHDNLRGVLTDFLIAGTDTVATSLTWFLTMAICYPEIQAKVISEIDNVIGRERFPTLADRHQLPYVESFVLEIFRFSGFVPLGLPHVTSEDVQIEGYIIPNGTVVIPNAYEALRDPKRWDEPETFKPERFLTEDGSTVDRNVARNVDLIFGHGKRICPGETLAKDEIFLFIAGLCQRYTFERDPQWNYAEKIETELGITLIPIPHTLIINKRK